MKFKVDKLQLGCIILGIIFGVLSFAVENNAAGQADCLERNSYGEGEKEEEIIVGGLVEEEIPITINLGEREYGQTQADSAFIPAYEQMMAGVLGENESFDSVRTDMKLPVWLEEYGMAVEWESENNDLIEASGEVHGENCQEKGETVNLTATLKAGDYMREYVIPIRVLPPDRTEAEAKISGFLRLIIRMDKEQRLEEKLNLPGEYEGKSLYYRKKSSGDYLMFPPLGILGAILLSLRKGQQEKEQKKKRERSLLCDYSEIISKLVVFLGAGLPARKAWERIVCDYEKKADLPEKRRPAYEEMAHVYYLMGRGVPETRAYAEFGDRCRILPYRKLSGILEQNVRNGTGDLCRKLEAEMQDAFEQRKQLARRLGEEAGTKLLLPLFILLAVVMVMVSLPAFLSFGL